MLRIQKRARAVIDYLVLPLCIIGVGLCAYLITGLLMGEAHAQTIYKCGRTYADQPCGPEAVKLAAPASRPALPESASIKPGLSETGALAALRVDGLYYRVHVLEAGRSISKQIVVGRNVETQWYIYTRDGTVTSVLW